MSMLAIGHALAWLGLFGPPTLPPPPTTSTPVVEQPTARVIIRCDPADFATLSAELRSRWPDAELLEYGGAAFDRVAGHPFVYLEVAGERLADAPQQLTLITSDGRAYVRSVNPRDAERARVLAIAGANLLAAVADEDVPPDREQAVVPLPEPETSGPPVAAKPPAAATPATRVAAPPPSLPRTEPRVEPLAPPPPRSDRDGWQLALDPSIAATIGLAPQARRGAPVLGGAFRLDVRAPFGLGFGAGLRVLSEVTGEHRLVRVRIAPTIGFIGRTGARRRLEGSIAIGPTFEPWRVLRGGAVQQLGSFGGRGYSMLYGGALQTALGYRVPLPGEQPLALRIGAHAELAASAMRQSSSALVRDAMRTRLFALGGVELGLGLDLALWFDLGPARARRGRAG